VIRNGDCERLGTVRERDSYVTLEAGWWVSIAPFTSRNRVVFTYMLSEVYSMVKKSYPKDRSG
jgi:hypothetical protein